MSRRARRVWLVVLLVALGAVTNVAVAWMCVLRWQGGLTAYAAPPLKPGDAGERRWVHQASAYEEFPAEPPSCVPFPSEYSGIDDPRVAQTRIHVLQAGWPLRTLTDTSFYPTNSTFAAAGGVPVHTLPRWAQSLVFRIIDFEPLFAFTLPFTPLWIGSVVNTGLYAAGWWLLIGGTRLLYRDHVGYLRRRKGRCPRCAYDLRADFDSGCPECGWKRGGAKGVAA